MRLLHIASIICFSTMLLSSCQNEIEDTVTPPVVEPEDTAQVPMQGKLLWRAVTRTLGREDSTQHEYEYDAQGQIIKATIKSIGDVENMGYTDSEGRIYRNSDGSVRRWVEVSTTYEAKVVVYEDSSVCEMVYDAASKKYKYSINTINVGGDETLRIRDSISYTYNTKGQISIVQVFRKDKTTGLYFEGQRAEYEYDAVGNVIKHRYNENYDNTGEPLSEIRFEYDDKISPIANIGNIGLLRGYLTINYPSPNNPVRAFHSSWSQPYVYIYNQYNQPSRLTVHSTIDQEESFVDNLYYMP